MIPPPPAENPTPEPLVGICVVAEPAEVLAPLQSAEDLARDSEAPPKQPLRPKLHYLLGSAPAPEPATESAAEQHAPA